MLGLTAVLELAAVLGLAAHGLSPTSHGVLALRTVCKVCEVTARRAK